MMFATESVLWELSFFPSTFPDREVWLGNKRSPVVGWGELLAVGTRVCAQAQRRVRRRRWAQLLLANDDDDLKSAKLPRRLKLLPPSLFVCRCGFISRYQLQPGPEVLHRGYWWPNVQGSRSCLHGRKGAKRRARDFHPARELVPLSLSRPQNKMALRWEEIGELKGWALCQKLL